MSTKSSIILTDDNEHWYRELSAQYNFGIETEDDWCFVLEFDVNHIIDLGDHGLEVAIDPASPLGEKLKSISFKEAKGYVPVEQALALISGVVPEGMALVPVNPTEKMKAAAGKVADQAAIENYGGPADPVDIYHAMIDAELGAQ